MVNCERLIHISSKYFEVISSEGFRNCPQWMWNRYSNSKLSDIDYLEDGVNIIV